jgi:hypothetical protein
MDVYEKGRFAAPLDEVKANISRCGELDVCDFAAGFFEDTMPTLEGRCVMAFLDVDLIDSLPTCVKAIWPRLQDSCRMYVHEARSLGFVSLFFDSPWCPPRPGRARPGRGGHRPSARADLWIGARLCAERNARALESLTIGI